MPMSCCACCNAVRTGTTGTGTYDAACMVCSSIPFGRGMDGRTVDLERGRGGGLGLCGYLNLAVQSSVWKMELPPCQTAAIVRQTRPCCASNRSSKKNKKKTVDRQGKLNRSKKKKDASRSDGPPPPVLAGPIISDGRPHCWDQDRDLCVSSLSEANGTCRPPRRRHIISCSA